MDDDLTPKHVPKSGGGEGPSEKQTGKKNTTSQQNNMESSDGNERSEAKTFVISVFIFACLEACGLCFSDSAAGVNGFALVFVHWLALCCFIAGPFSVWHEMSNVNSLAGKFKHIWLWYLLVCALALFPAWLIWRPEPPPLPEPQPQLSFDLSASTSKLSVPLTNDFLIFRRDNVLVSEFNGLVIIPVPHGQNTLMIAFRVKNHVDIEAEDLEFKFRTDPKLNIVPAPEYDRLGEQDGRLRDLTLEKPFIGGRNTEWLPEINLSPSIVSEHFLTNMVPFSVCVKGKNVPLFAIGFWLVFADEGTNEYPTQVIKMDEFEKRCKILKNISTFSIMSGEWRK